MYINYDPLWKMLRERGLKKEDLRIRANLTSNIIANMGKNENISMNTLMKICSAMDCDIHNVIRLVHEKRKYQK